MPDRPERIAVSAAGDTAALAASCLNSRWHPEVVARYLDRLPVTRLSADSSPALILHGREDRCVADQRERILRWLATYLESTVEGGS